MTAPKLKRAEWMQTRDAFEKLADLPSGARDIQLEKMSLPPAIADRVRAMLSAGDTPGMLDSRIAAPLDGPAPSAYASLVRGTVIGGFKIERLIGRGGMGEVYLAHRDDAGFEQRVALKMLRPEAAGRFDLFNAERRMLAVLEHPGIARLIDGGMAPDGRPYMALEYVEGQEINAWCVDHHADLVTRLRLFLELSDAVSYAHARLVVHRDIKPANILVDGEGRARLLDFGIARLLDAAAADRTMTQAMATPQYAAPEQFDGSPLTVATDVYALGAVLFELLAGRGPWRFGDAAPLPTVLRRLLHEEPPLPSTIADGSAVGAAQIAGDLDAIVSKAMRRTPADRYASVQAMAEDVRRHLSFRPVQARAGATGYRLRRYLRRNRWGVVAAATICAVLLAGTAGVVWQARKAADERALARAEAERLEAVNQAMMLMFRDASDASQLESITVRELIDDTTKRMAGSLSAGSRNSAATVGALADLYQIVENNVDAKRLLTTALARGIGSGDPAGSARLKLKLATILVEERQFDHAQRLLNEAEVVWRTDPVLFRRERVETVGTAAYMLRLQGRRAEGIALLIGNLPEAERAYADYNRDLATRYANLVMHLTEANRLAEADVMIRRGRATLARANQNRSAAALTMLRIQAGIASRRGDDRAAEAMLRQVIADRRTYYGRSVALAIDLLHHARVLNQLGRPRDALLALNEAMPMSIELFGANTQPTLMMALSRADALLALGDVNGASQALESVSNGLRKQGPISLFNGARLLTQAKLSLARDDVVASRAQLDEAERVFRTVGPAATVHARALATVRTELAARGKSSKTFGGDGVDRQSIQN